MRRLICKRLDQKTRPIPSCRCGIDSTTPHMLWRLPPASNILFVLSCGVSKNDQTD
jgi:hypothetical protein